MASNATILTVGTPQSVLRVVFLKPNYQSMSWKSCTVPMFWIIDRSSWFMSQLHVYTPASVLCEKRQHISNQTSGSCHAITVDSKEINCDLGLWNMDSPNSVVPSLGGARLGKKFTSYELLNKNDTKQGRDNGRLYTKTRFMLGIVTSNNHFHQSWASRSACLCTDKSIRPWFLHMLNPTTSHQSATLARYGQERIWGTWEAAGYISEFWRTLFPLWLYRLHASPFFLLTSVPSVISFQIHHGCRSLLGSQCFPKKHGYAIWAWLF